MFNLDCPLKLFYCLNVHSQAAGCLVDHAVWFTNGSAVTGTPLSPMLPSACLSASLLLVKVGKKAPCKRSIWLGQTWQSREAAQEEFSRLTQQGSFILQPEEEGPRKYSRPHKKQSFMFVPCRCKCLGLAFLALVAASYPSAKSLRESSLSAHSGNGLGVI